MDECNQFSTVPKTFCGKLKSKLNRTVSNPEIPGSGDIKVFKESPDVVIRARRRVLPTICKVIKIGPNDEVNIDKQICNVEMSTMENPFKSSRCKTFKENDTIQKDDPCKSSVPQILPSKACSSALSKGKQQQNIRDTTEETKPCAATIFEEKLSKPCSSVLSKSKQKQNICNITEQIKPCAATVFKEKEMKPCSAVVSKTENCEEESPDIPLNPLKSCTCTMKIPINKEKGICKASGRKVDDSSRLKRKQSCEDSHISNEASTKLENQKRKQRKLTCEDSKRKSQTSTTVATKVKIPRRFLRKMERETNRPSLTSKTLGPQAQNVPCDSSSKSKKLPTKMESKRNFGLKRRTYEEIMKKKFQVFWNFYEKFIKSATNLNTRLEKRPGTPIRNYGLALLAKKSECVNPDGPSTSSSYGHKKSDCVVKSSRDTSTPRRVYSQGGNMQTPQRIKHQEYDKHIQRRSHSYTGFSKSFDSTTADIEDLSSHTSTITNYEPSGDFLQECPPRIFVNYQEQISHPRQTTPKISAKVSELSPKTSQCSITNQANDLINKFNQKIAASTSDNTKSSNKSCLKPANCTKEPSMSPCKKRISFDFEDIIINKIYTKNIQCIDPEDIKQLVKEENKDIETFTKFLDPSINVSVNPGGFAANKKLGMLKINTEDIALLYKSLWGPLPSGDTAQVEPSPEALASMMYILENQIDPNEEPSKNFNALFKSTLGNDKINISPVAEGYYQDVIVPIKEPDILREQVVTNDLHELTLRFKKEIRDCLKGDGDCPSDNLFTLRNNPDEINLEKLNKHAMKDMENCDICDTANHIGAEPLDILDMVDVDITMDLQEDLRAGVQYYVNAELPQYMSRIQLRGNAHPPWFPGYVFANPSSEQAVQLVTTPSEVFRKAWKAVHPQYFKEKDVTFFQE